MRLSVSVRVEVEVEVEVEMEIEIEIEFECEGVGLKKSVGGLAGSKGRCIFALPKRPVRLGVRTPGFHPGSRGSIPLRATHRNRFIRGCFFVL